MSLLPTLLLCALAPLQAAPARDAAEVKAAQMHYLRATLLHKRGEHAAALQEYETAFAADPLSAYIAREAAQHCLEQGDTAGAARWAERTLALEPRKAETHVLLGQVHWALGDAKAAETSFETALKLDPKSGESIFSLGTLLSARSPEKARDLLERFMRDNPEQASEAHYQLAKLDMQAGRLDEAESHLKEGAALDPDNLSILHALAQTYEIRRSTEAAIRAYRDILKYDSRNVLLMNRVAELHQLMGAMEEARAQFGAVLLSAPGDPVATLWLAIDAERRGEYAAAAEVLKTSAALLEDASLSLRLSFYLSQAGRIEEAVEALEKARARWPGNDQLAYFLALGYDDLKRSGQAVKVLREVLELKPHYRDARYQLAVLLERQGDVPAAEREFRLLLADKPDDASVLNYLGYSLADRGLRLAEAEGLIREAVRLEPGRAAYRDSLGWALFRLGRSTEALTELARAVAGAPEDGAAWSHLGDAREALGEPAAAWLAWKRAESLSSTAGVSKKARKLQAQLTAPELGALYLQHLFAVQGGVGRLSGLCKVHGAVLGKTFSYGAMLTFRAPDELSVDFLGPLFTPLFRVRFDGQGFRMDPLRIEGLRPEAVNEAVYGTFSALRDYLSGSLFALRPAAHKKSWGKEWVEAPGWRLGLDRKSGFLTALAPEAGTSKLALSDFERFKGRVLPKTFTASGAGYSVSVSLDQFNVEFR